MNSIARFDTSSLPAIVEDDRTVRYVFSTPDVARDGNKIDQTGWDLSGFKKNPVFLWAHDQSAPPIGQVLNIGLQSGNLCGTVKYAGADISPFADMIFKMVKQGILNAVSVSWMPLEWKYSTDRSRAGGIDFVRQDLLEISQVPVPAQSTALVTARARGIDTTPFAQWAEHQLAMRPRGESDLARLCAARKMAMTPRLNLSGSPT